MSPLGEAFRRAMEKEGRGKSHELPAPRQRPVPRPPPPPAGPAAPVPPAVGPSRVGTEFGRRPTIALRAASMPLRPPTAELKVAVPPGRRPTAELKAGVPLGRRPTAELRGAAPPGRRPTGELRAAVPPGRRPTVALRAASPPAGPPPTVALPVTSAPAGFQSLLPLPGTDAGGYIARATRVATFAEGPLSPGCDELAGLRAALFSLGLDAPPASILVAGVSAQAQTTVVASGLAGELARDLAHHVLLADANVRRPGVARLLEVDPELDLADVLESRADAAEAIVYSEGDNLSALVLRADPQTGASRVSAEAFLAESAREVFAGLSGAFDYVVVDAGAVDESAAARVLASRVSGAVLVVPRGVSRERARAARSGVEGAGGRVLGVVLTDARATRGGKSVRRRMHRGRRREAPRR